MNNNELFITATRRKLRFHTDKGNATVEDLWDLDRRALDTIHKNLKAQQRRADEESLLDTKSDKEKVLETKIAVVKAIFDIKTAEITAAETAAAAATKRAKIDEILAAREAQELENMTTEELQKMRDSLN